MKKRNKKENKIDIGELLLRRDSSSNGSCSRPVLNLLQYRVKYWVCTKAPPQHRYKNTGSTPGTKGGWDPILNVDSLAVFHTTSEYVCTYVCDMAAKLSHELVYSSAMLFLFLNFKTTWHFFMQLKSSSKIATISWDLHILYVTTSGIHPGSLPFVGTFYL
jgi:hypothetical protein